MLEEVSTSVPIISLIAASRLDKDSNSDALPRRLFRGDPHSVRKGSHLHEFEPILSQMDAQTLVAGSFNSAGSIW